jgi:2-methylcitrate dehydratase PrpD
MTSHTAQLAAFAAQLRFDAIPEPVVRKAEDLLVDLFGSAVAGHGSRPVESITRFAMAMGPQAAPGCDMPTAGPSEVITRRAWSSPYLAAMANAAASHFAEQDDVHNGSRVPPGGGGVSRRRWQWPRPSAPAGADLLTASAWWATRSASGWVNFSAGRTTRSSTPPAQPARIAAAAAVGWLLEVWTPPRCSHAFGSAGTQAAGLWEFLRTAADSKQLHTAHAAGAGLTAAYLGKPTVSPARQAIFDGKPRVWPPA